MITPEERDHLHPVSQLHAGPPTAGRWSGCPGRHAALRFAMAPWFAPEVAARREPVVTAIAEEAAGERIAASTRGPFDAYHDYALPPVGAVGGLADSSWVSRRRR